MCSDIWVCSELNGLACACRVAWICPEPVAPHLEHYIGPWCAALRSVRDDVEKEHAFLGLAALLRINPLVSLSAGWQFRQLMRRCKSPLDCSKLENTCMPHPAISPAIRVGCCPHLIIHKAPSQLACVLSKMAALLQCADILR